MELCSMLCGSLDGRGVWGRIHVYVWMDHFAVRLKLSQYCQSAIPQYKMKIKKKKTFELTEPLQGHEASWAI